MQHTWAKTIGKLLLLTALYAVSGIAQETPSGMQLAGLAVHQETGRSIYLGGIYVDASLSRPFEYIDHPGLPVSSAAAIQVASLTPVQGLREDGSLLEVSVVQSSGHNILDEAAVKAAEQAFGTDALGSIDPVAVAEFSTTDSGNLVIPVPVTFMLTQ